MRKSEELTDPNSCMSKARDDEFTFVTLERDIAAPATVRFWARKRVRLGKNKWNDSQIVEALEWADKVEAIHVSSSLKPLDIAYSGTCQACGYTAVKCECWDS